MKIVQLQSLRFIFIALIFLYHAKVFASFVEWPWMLGRGAAFAVSFFIVLSGFLAGYNCPENPRVSFRAVGRFMWRKVVRFWPLFALVTLLSATYANPNFYRLAVSGDTNALMAMVGDLSWNLCLLQAWNQKTVYSYCGVGWFLSMLMFCYLITLPAQWAWKRLMRRVGLISLAVSIVLIVGLGFAYAYCVYALNDGQRVAYGQYLAYNFPIGRMFEYVAAIGIGLAVKMFDDKVKWSAACMSVLEIMAISLAVFSLCRLNLPRWAAQGIFWIVPSVILCVIFSLRSSRGLVSHALSWRPLVALGGISMEFYLVHQFVISILVRFGHPAPSQYVRANVIGLLYCLVISILLAFCLNISSRSHGNAKEKQDLK